jgi:hypothetical protein
MEEHDVAGEIWRMSAKPRAIARNVTYALQLTSGETDTPDAEAALVSMTRPLTQFLF